MTRGKDALVIAAKSLAAAAAVGFVALFVGAAWANARWPNENPTGEDRGTGALGNLFVALGIGFMAFVATMLVTVAILVSRYDRSTR